MCNSVHFPILDASFLEGHTPLCTHVWEGCTYVYTHTRLSLPAGLGPVVGTARAGWSLIIRAPWGCETLYTGGNGHGAACLLQTGAALPQPHPRVGGITACKVRLL